jgi:hypothetical protein
MLTQLNQEFTVRSMKKKVFNLSLETVLRTAQQATQNAARDAVASGRVVTGWKDGQLAEYGPNALPLSPIVSDEGGANACGT